MQKGGVEKIYIGLKMAPVSRTGGGQIRTGPTGKLPEIVRRTGVYFRPWYRERHERGWRGKFIDIFNSIR